MGVVVGHVPHLQRVMQVVEEQQDLLRKVKRSKVGFLCSPNYPYQ
jgi:hypothetical protein